MHDPQWQAAKKSLLAAEATLYLCVPKCGWEGAMECIEHTSCEAAQDLQALWARLLPARMAIGIKEVPK